MTNDEKYTIMAIILKNQCGKEAQDMKMSTVQIRYDSEKLNALQKYRSEAELRAGLEAHIQELYERNVPAELRKAPSHRDQSPAE